MTRTPIMGGANDPLNNTAGAVEYHSLQGCGNATWSSTSTTRGGLLSPDGFIYSLTVRLSVDPGGTYTFIIWYNGAQLGQPCVINAGEIEKSITFTPVSCGHASIELQLQVTASAVTTPTATPAAHWWVGFDSVTRGYTPWNVGQNGNQNPTTGTVYSPIFGDQLNWSATEINRHQVCPCSGTLRDLFGLMNLSPGAGITVTVDVRVNGASPAGTLVVAFTAGTLNPSDQVNTVTVTAGDRLDFRLVVSGGTATARNLKLGLTFIPATVGDFITMATAGANSPTDGQVDSTSGFGLWAASTNTGDCTPHITAKAIYVWLNAAVGAGKTRTFWLLVNDVKTGCFVDMPNLATANRKGFQIDVPQGAVIKMLENNSNAPTSAGVSTWGILWNMVEQTEWIVRTRGGDLKLHARYHRMLKLY